MLRINWLSLADTVSLIVESSDQSHASAGAGERLKQAKSARVAYLTEIA
jgi:hypothetical protein